jgi:hypothetical protein
MNDLKIIFAVLFLCFSNFASADFCGPNKNDTASNTDLISEVENIGPDPHLQNIFPPGILSNRVCNETVSKLFRVDGLNTNVDVKVNGKEEIETQPVSTCEQLRNLDNTAATKDYDSKKLSALKSVCNSLVTLNCDNENIGAANVFMVTNGNQKTCKVIMPSHFFHEKAANGSYAFKKRNNCKLNSDSISASEYKYVSCLKDRAGQPADENHMCKQGDYKDACSPIRGYTAGVANNINIEEEEAKSFGYIGDVSTFEDDIVQTLDEGYCTNIGAAQINVNDIDKKATKNCDFVSATSINGVEYIDLNEMSNNLKQSGYPINYHGANNVVTHSGVTFKGTSGSIMWCYDKNTGNIKPLYMATAMKIKSQDLIDMASGYVIGESQINLPSQIERYGVSLSPLKSK